MPDTPQWAEIIDRAVEDRLVDVHTCLPGKVTKYDDSTQTVDVELQVVRVLEDEQGNKVVERLPKLVNVPFCFPRMGGTYITWPIQNGDFVDVQFNEQSIDRWRSTGDVSDPGDRRRHGLQGAIAKPGAFPVSQALSSSAYDSGAVVIGPNVKLGSSNASEQMLLGTFYRNQESTLNNNLSTQLLAAGAALVVAGTDPVLVALAPQAAAALNTAGVALNAIGPFITAFEALSAQYLSNQIEGE